MVVVRLFPTCCFTSCSGARRISHIALDLLAKRFCEILRLFQPSSLVSLLTAINFRHFASVDSREIILALTAFKVSGIVKNHYLEHIVRI